MKLRLALALVVVLVAFAASNSFAVMPVAASNSFATFVIPDIDTTTYDTTTHCYTAADTCWVCWKGRGFEMHQVYDLTYLDLHACDTVRVGCPVITDSVRIGDSIAVPLYLFNDEPISGLSLGFIKDSSAVKFRRFVKNAAVIPPSGDFSWITKVADTTRGWVYYFPPSGIRESTWVDVPHAQNIHLGGADLTKETPIPAVTENTGQLLGTIYLLIQTGAQQEYITIDSSLIPPAGRWELTYAFDTLTVRFVPNYAHCSPDIYLPVQEYDSPNLPEAYTLGQNSPNPFNPNTSIEFALPRSGQVKVEVFNILGQRVRTLVDENLKAGFKRVDWDGTDESGQSVASGVYLYRMTADDFSETKKMVLLK